MRESADAAICAVERAGGSAGDDYWELGGRLDAVTEVGGDASTAIPVSRVAVVGSGVREIRLDALGGGTAGVGIFRMAEGT